MSDPQPVRLAKLARTQWQTLRELATTIWHEHYAGIITRAQMDYMLGERFSDAGLSRLAEDPSYELALLWQGEQAVGYCGSGPTGVAKDFKLGQLYLRGHVRGQGLGRVMLAHVEQRAWEAGATALVLQVNKRNALAIAFYQRQGFAVREEAVFDIGNGFVMDDYVMEKPLAGILPST